MSNDDFIMQMGMFEQRAQQIEQQLQIVDENLVDLERLKEGLDELKNAKGKEIFASIGRGIFVKARIEEDQVLTDVGGKNFIKKDVEESKNMLDDQIIRISAFKTQLLDELQNMNVDFQKFLNNIEDEKVDE